MTCICQARQLSESFKEHSYECEQQNQKERISELQERVKWETQDHQCSGSGYSHKAHGKCQGYTYDRT